MTRKFGLPALCGILIATMLYWWLDFDFSEPATFALYFIAVAVAEIVASVVRAGRGTEGGAAAEEHEAQG